jgi:hypothetical protein
VYLVLTLVALFVATFCYTLRAQFMFAVYPSFIDMVLFFYKNIYIVSVSDFTTVSFSPGKKQKHSGEGSTVETLKNSELEGTA